MSTTPELYEALADISGRMVEAAHANDWDRLAALDAEMTATRDTIARQPDNGAVGDAELLRRAALIGIILENNREVRRHVEPWMASVRKLFGSGERERSVRAAYGASPR